MLSERREALRKKSGALYPQLESVLTQLAARLPLFLVSNCQAGYIETFLDCTGFAPYITDHLCPGDTGEGKAENIREIIRRHHLKSPVYVGDTRRRLPGRQICRRFHSFHLCFLWFRICGKPGLRHHMSPLIFSACFDFTPITCQKAVL